MIITSLSLLLDYCFMYYLREADFRYHCVAKRERYRKKNTTKTTAPPPPTPTHKKERTSFIFCRTGSVGRALE